MDSWATSFLAGGVTIALPLSKAIRVKAKRNQLFLYEKKSEKLALILAWITIFVMCYGLKNFFGYRVSVVALRKSEVEIEKRTKADFLKEFLE
jgi:hypothetical protein